MRPKNLKKTTGTGLVIVAVVLLAIGAIILVQPHPREVKEAYGSYSLNTQMKVMDQLRSNSLYGNNTTLIDPATVYRSITKDLYINVSISYFNSQGVSQNLTFTYDVILISSNPSWEKSTYTFSKRLSAGSNYVFSQNIEINVSSNVTTGNDINSQLGFSTGSSYSIYMAATTISSFGTSSSNITLSVGSTTYGISGPTDAPVSGVYYRNAVIPGKVIIPVSRDVSYPLLAIALAVIGYLAYVSYPGKPDYLERFRKANSDNLIELLTGPPEGSTQVKSTDDIFKIASFSERPVFIYENLIYVEVDGKTYFAEIKK